MKHSILLLIIVLPLMALIGCTSIPSDGDGEVKKESETVPASKVHLDLIGLSYYWCSGSMAGIDYNYSIFKAPTGAYLFRAEIESENRIVEKNISQKKFDAIMQMVNDNYLTEPDAESKDTGDEYELLDADSYDFVATFADGQTQSIELGLAGSKVLSQLEKLLEES